MIKIENVVLPSAEQMEFIIHGMRNPMNSWDKSDSTKCKYGLDCDICEHSFYSCNEFSLGENDWKLMINLANAGSDHRKFMRMMPVYARITAPLYWWKEFDTYKVGTVSNSCSTMHKITEKEFTLEDFSTEHLIVEDDVNHIDMIGWFQKQIDILNEWRLTYLDVDDSPVSAEARKNYWWQMIQLLPSSYNQTRNVMTNYEALVNIYRQRKNHKLDEWREFCKWIEKISYSELITGSPVLIKDIVIQSEPVPVGKKALETIEETTQPIQSVNRVELPPYDKSFIKKKGAKENDK